MSGRFRKGWVKSGKSVRFRKGNRYFSLHARTNRKRKKIIDYFRLKGWKVFSTS